MVLLLKESKPRNVLVDESFIQVINDKYKGVRATCKYCQKKLDKNTSHLQDYLNICKKYQETARLGQTPVALHTLIAWSQQEITIIVQTSPQNRAKHLARAVKAVYMINLPFSHYENKYVAAYLHNLDSFYKALSHGALVGLLLAQCYEEVKGKVDVRLRTPRFLNFYIDESNNICQDRVINFLVHTPKSCDTEGRCFYICSESNSAKMMDAKA